MEQMRFSVVPELLRAYDARHLRIKMREEAGAAKQEPVKKEDVVELHRGKPIAFDELGFENGGAEEYRRASELIFDRICELGADISKTAEEKQ